MHHQVSLYSSAEDREEMQESSATICEQTSAGKIVEEKPPKMTDCRNLS